MGEKRILLSVGDDSGDLHAANMMGEIRKLEPQARFVGCGMERMAEAGLEELHLEAHRDGAVWFGNLSRIGHYRHRLDLFRRYMDEDGVDLVIPVDFGGFNLCLCRAATERGIPVYYYIPPQVWASRQYRLKKLRKWTTRCALIYPFERELYRRWGVEAEYVGHPLFDEIDRHPPSTEAVAELRERFGDCLVALFPGSRPQEVRANMPVFVSSCRRVAEAMPEVRFALLCPAKVQELVRKGCDRAGIALLDDVRPTELARASRLCVAKSGTIVLEVASQGTPMVIMYRAATLMVFFAWGSMTTPHVALINNLAGRKICPERPMPRDEPAWLVEQTLRLLGDERAYERCRSDIAEALSGFAVPGASARAARGALELL